MAYVVCHWAWLSDSISPSIEHVSVVALFLSLGLLTRHRYVLAGVSAMGIAALRYPSGIFTLAILTALSIRTLRGEMTPRALVRFLVGLTVGTRLWMHRPARWLAKVASLFLPFALLGSSLAAVTLVNYVYYSERSVTETKQPEFVAAMGALMRVSHERWAPFVVVPAEVREDVYRESPTFALLRPHLEAHAEVGLGLGARRRLGIDGDPRYVQEIPGGWFMWSLRDAVARMGFYSYAPDARRFYHRLTDEINAACAAGRLACGAAPATLAPPWRREYLPSMARALWRGTKDLLLMTEHPVLSELRSTGPTPALAMVADLTGDRDAGSESHELSGTGGCSVPRISSATRDDRWSGRPVVAGGVQGRVRLGDVSSGFDPDDASGAARDVILDSQRRDPRPRDHDSVRGRPDPYHLRACRRRRGPVTSRAADRVRDGRSCAPRSWHRQCRRQTRGNLARCRHIGSDGPHTWAHALGRTSSGSRVSSHHPRSALWAIQFVAVIESPVRDDRPPEFAMLESAPVRIGAFRCR